MRTPEQMPFDIDHAPTYTRADFSVSDCNKNAMSWIQKHPDWPAPALIIYGPPGCGKTHLAHIWQAMTQATNITKSAKVHGLGTLPKAIVIDDVESFIGNAEKERDLFHLYNVIKESSGHLLLTAKEAPQNWDFILPDLKSRLIAAPAVSVGSPDDALMAIILTKIFSDKQIFVPQEVITFLLPRIERSFAAVRTLAEEINKQALTEKRAVTIPLVRHLLNKET